MARTRGISYLEKEGIPFEERCYDHQVKGARFAAESTGIPLEMMIKSLLIQVDEGSFVFALMPGDQELSLKKLARAAGVRKAAMAKPEDAQRVTGYLVGGMSPLGARKAFPVYLHQSLDSFPSVTINAGQRGVLVTLATADLKHTVRAVTADIAE